MVAGSFGFHLWAPLNSAIGLALSNKQNAGYVLGALTSVGSLAGIAGMGAISLISGLLPSMPLTYYVVGGIVIVVSSLLLYLLPKHLGTTEVEPSRILIKGRYWRYYVLIFFSGARKLVLGSFILMLVENFGLRVWHVSSPTLVGSVLTLALSPAMGRIIDRRGEQVTTPPYAVLALCCFGYAGSICGFSSPSGSLSSWSPPSPGAVDLCDRTAPPGSTRTHADRRRHL